MLINDKTLRIVFVSSEGSIVPRILTTSAINKCTSIQVIRDIGDEKAVEYLCDNKIPMEVAKRVVDIVVGRFVYLNMAISKQDKIINGQYGKIPNVASANIANNMTEEIVTLKTKPQKVKLTSHKDAANLLLQQLSTKGYVTMDSFDKGVQKALELLEVRIHINKLHYSPQGASKS